MQMPQGGGTSSPTAGTGGGGVGGLGSGGSGGSGGGGGAGGTTPEPQGPVKHRFLSGIAQGGPVAIVSDAGVIEWEVQEAGEANDVWLLPNGNVVHAYKFGARELTPAKQVVWDHPAAPGAETHSCQPLPGGMYLLGEAHPGGLAKLLEVDNTGTVKKTVTIQAPETQLGAHSQFREVRKTPSGTYIATYIDLNKAREFDAQGALVREFPCGAFVGVRLPDGNTLIACGDGHRVIEVDAQNNIVWEVGEKEIPGNQLAFAAGVHRLPNGNTVIANWPGHDLSLAHQPQVFELTREKEVVWEVKNPALKMISTIQILDANVEVDGRILR